MDVRTAQGWIRGAEHDDGAAFLGVPYGRAERFRAPTRPQAWDGTRDATAYGPSCPQPAPPGPEAEAAMALFGGIVEPSESEQCLVLNLWTPCNDDERRPVLVYLHGGGHAIGSGSWPVYDGAALATHGAVVITINHRLGVLGYLHLAHVLGEDYVDSGQAGMLDVIEALQWVRENVSAFGGDPGNVTVFGESGGGSKVAHLLTMPAARGLFHRAVVMSGWFDLAGATVEQAEQATTRVLELLGLAADDAHQILTIDPQRLVEVSVAMGGIDSGLYPVIDGRTLPQQPQDALRHGAAREIPLLIGTVRDEYSIFLPHIAVLTGGAPDAAIDDYLRTRFGDRIDDITAQYRRARPDLDADGLRVAIASDGHVRIPAIELAEAQLSGGGVAYMYRFDFASPLAPTLGAAHGLDVPFVFDTVRTAPVAGEGPTQSGLAREMGAAWLGFARTGVPTVDAAVTWPPYSRPDRATVIFDVKVSVALDPAGAERQAWAADHF